MSNRTKAKCQLAESAVFPFAKLALNECERSSQSKSYVHYMSINYVLKYDMYKNNRMLLRVKKRSQSFMYIQVLDKNYLYRVPD